MGCFGENTILAFAQARLPPATLTEVEAHARTCGACHDLLRAALNVSGLAETAVTDVMGPTPTLRAPGRPPFEKGTSIGRYTVLELVGRGGMGEVYAAYDPGLDRRVALKLMHSGGRGADPRGQERLLREGQAIAKLSHPNVVVVHDVGTFGEQVFVAMEYVDGSTLAAWLADQKRSWPEIVGIFIKAGRGLAAAHRAGFVHRDFKPQNVMVGRDGAVRVADFGLARRIDASAALDDGAAPRDSDEYGEALTQTGVRVGTPYYMAPEQVAGRAADARSDQFSFCIALYWALTGSHPFGGSTPTEVAKNVAAGKMPAAPGGVPPWLTRIVRRGLAPDPAERWPTMDDLLAVLSIRLTRPRRRIPIAVGIVLCGVAFGVGAVKFRQPGQALCGGGQASVLGFWELPDASPRLHREALRAVINRVANMEAPRIWERVSTLLDQRITDWLVTHRETCEATNVRHEQSPELMDLRMACLKDSLESTRALTELISRGDARVIEHAPEAIGSLDSIRRCSDATQLALGPRPPTDPVLRKRVDDLRARLREADALFGSTEYHRAAEAANTVLSTISSERLRYCPLETEALVLKGDAELSLDVPEGRKELENAIERAEGCGHDRMVARAATELVWAYAGQPLIAENFAALARGAIARLGGDGRLEGWLSNNLAVVFRMEGRLDEARASAEQSVAIKERFLGPDHIDTAISLMNLGGILVDAGHPAEGLKYYDRASQIEASWAGTHASLEMGTRINRAEALGQLGHLAEAKEIFETIVAELGEETDIDPRDVARTLTRFGEVLLREGEPARALRYLERARRIQVDTIEFPFEIAKNKFALARARAATAPGDGTALELAQQAASTYSTSPSFKQQYGDVTKWIADHHRQPAGRALLTR